MHVCDSILEMIELHDACELESEYVASMADSSGTVSDWWNRITAAPGYHVEQAYRSGTLLRLARTGVRAVEQSREALGLLRLPIGVGPWPEALAQARLFAAFARGAA